MTNAARLWAELEIDGKTELQQAIFPEGVSFDGEEFGTAVTSMAFKHFEALRPTGTDLASPTGREFNLNLASREEVFGWLERLETLRKTTRLAVA